MKDMGAEIKHIREDCKATKSMAEIAKQRTEIDYSKYSGKADGKICYKDTVTKDCASCKYGYSTSVESEPCCNCIQYRPTLPKWEAKENE